MMSARDTMASTEAASVSAPGQLRMTQEEFLRWDHAGIAEWINGDVITMSVRNEHQRIVDFLNRLIGVFVELFGLGILRSAPYAMRIVPDGSIREPDLMFVRMANRQRLTPDLLDGPADLVIEVVSEDSVARDYDQKFVEYQNGGVREYWIIDPRPDRQRVSFFVLGLDGVYRPVALDEAGVYRSTVLTGFWLDPAWLWSAQREGDPDALRALVRMIGPEAVISALKAE